MTRKVNKQGDRSPSTRGTASPVEWVNVRIDDDMVSDLEERFSTESDVAGWLLALMQETTNFYIKYDPKSGAYSAGHIADDPDVEGRVCGLSGWADNPFDALRSLLYKWYVVLGQTWPETQVRVTTRFR